MNDTSHDGTADETGRRRFLAALAASGVALGATATTEGPAQAAEPGGVGDPNEPVAVPGSRSPNQPRAYPAPTPGLTYRVFLGSSFFPTTSGAVYSKGFGEVQSAGIFFRALTDLPVGSRLAELSFAVIKSALFPGNTSAFFYRMTSGGSLQLLGPSINTVGFGQSTSEQYLNFAVPADTLVTADSDLWMVVNMGNNRLNSVRVGYVPPAPSFFFPIPPKRVYDSRFVAPTGTLGSGGGRTVSVADGYPLGSGVVDLPGVVPAGATAIAFNLAITATAGAGFLSVNPGGAITFGAASINWATANTTMANGLVGLLGGDRQFTVFCGGTPDARAHFIIDVLGYYR